MKKIIVCLLLTALLGLGSLTNLSAQTWTNTGLLPEQRADALVSAMTLDEKVALVHAARIGTGQTYSGNLTNNVRLGIPAVNLQDGPAGVGTGGGGTVTGVTAFPAPLTIAASWDVALARGYGLRMGQEHRAKGVNVQLGPMMNLSRVPQDGRNFEGYGEDPKLSAAMAAAEIPGIQSQQVIANIKHFVGYEEETDRGQASSDIGQAAWDDRILQEIYYAPFLACVRAGAGSVMSSYNRLHLRFAGESEQLNATLKKRWGFDGFVITDWFAGFSTVGGANNGLDVEMYSSGWFSGTLLTPAIQTGLVPSSDLDGMAHRILTTMFRFGVFDFPATGNLGLVVTNADHAQFARDAAAQGMVLLKNSGSLLPLNPTAIHSLAVIGSVASAAPISTGGGSASVSLPYNITPLAGLASRAGAAVTVTYAQGDGASLSQAATLAANSDMAIVCVGQRTSEGSDRSGLSLPNNQDALISAVAAANPHTIVVLYASGATLMPWVDQVAGILVAWYPGQENGNALASVVFGDVNPGGKLPVTFPVSADQVPCHTAAQYPGIAGHAAYSEGLQIGYRWYDANNVAPLYPFGHGLSYTTFGYSNLTVSAVSPAGQVQIRVDLTNTGKRPGAEVAQLYLGYPAAAHEPPKLLKAFQKIPLVPGQTRQVTFNLDWEDLANWDEVARGWVVTPGTFQVLLGASSRDLRLTGDFTVGSIPSSDLANAALHHLATASSTLSTNPPAGAVDGDCVSTWNSLVSDPQWIAVDLGVTKDLSRVRLLWNTNFASSYQIQRSLDGTNWTIAFSTNSDCGGLEDVLVSGSGRFVRIYTTQPGVAGQGYSLAELEVYSQPQVPWDGSVMPLPGVVPAANYDTGGQGVAYGNSAVGNAGGSYRTDDVGIEPTTDTGGGYDVGYLNAGEWLEYTVNAPDSEATYSISARVASPSGGGQLRVRLDGTVLGTFTIPKTGGWQNWQTVWLPNIPIAGGVGSQALRLEVLSSGFNLNWIALNRTAFCGTNNLALNQPVTCSSYNANAPGGSLQDASYAAACAVDGDPRTRWAEGAGDPQWLAVDLGTNCNLARVRLNWENALAKGYEVQISADNVLWNNVYATTNHLETLDDLAITGCGRYVRVYCTQRGTVFNDSLWDFEVYPALNPCWALQPSSQSTAVGNTVELNAVLSSDQPMACQWYHESTPVAGATGTNLVLVNLGAAEAGNYWLMASNSLATLVSSVAQVSLVSVTNGMVAQDSAANYPAENPMPGGQNFGFGFGPWVLTVIGGGGCWVAGPPLMFDLWSFSANAASLATRPFNVPLAPGQTFSVQLENYHLNHTNIYNLLELQAPNGAVLFSLFWQGTNNAAVSADAQITDAGGTRAATGFGFNSGVVSTYAFTLNNATHYTMTDKTTGASVSGTLSGTAIQQVCFIRSNNVTASLGDGGQDFQFNSLTLTAAPLSTPLTLAKLAQGWGMSFAVAPGYAYRLQRATNVIGPWTEIGTLLGPVGGFSKFIDTNSPTSRSFYRSVTP